VRAADDRVVALIIRRHGAVLDLRAEPETLIEVLRRFGPVVSAEPISRRRRARRRLARLGRAVRARLRLLRRYRSPSPPTATPDPVVQPTNAEVMKEVLSVARKVEELRRELVVHAG
jgi:hypothetical protein